MFDQQLSRLQRTDGGAAGWAVSPGLVGYEDAVAAMEARAAAIRGARRRVGGC